MKALLQFPLSAKHEGMLRAALPPWVDLIIETEDQGFNAALSEAIILLHVLKPVTADIIWRATKLKLIQKIGVGVNTIDLNAAKEKGVRIANMPGANSQAVAEHTLMLMLALLRKVRQFDEAARAGPKRKFDPEFFDTVGELSGRVVGFVGFGAIPQRLAPVLACLGATVIFTMSSKPSIADATQVSLETLLKNADILSLHIPLTAETVHLVDRSFLGRMKQNSILINTARGGLIKQADLVECLRERRLAGAGLDVTEDEPIAASDPLTSLENVVLTPHIAWLTPETLQRSFTVIAKNCIRLRNGLAPINEVHL